MHLKAVSLMIRDLNLCRAILHGVESKSCHVMSYDLASFPEVSLLTTDANIIGYHCAILVDAGLIKGQEKGWDSSPYACEIQRLTWDGHEFLDASRDDGKWAQVRDAAKGLRNWTFSAIASALKQKATEELIGLFAGQ